jgi:hypothetical protein
VAEAETSICPQGKGGRGEEEPERPQGRGEAVAPGGKSDTEEISGKSAEEEADEEGRKAMNRIPGICRYCRCTEATPCSTPPCGEPCTWANRNRDVCSNPQCLLRWARDRRAAEAAYREKTRKRTPAEIHELIRSKGRRSAQRALKGIKPKGGNAA